MTDTEKTKKQRDDLDRTRIVSSPDVVDGDRTVLSIPDSAAQPTLEFSATTGNSYGLSREFVHEHILFDIRSDTVPQGAASRGRLPLNISLIIDRSGSMEGEPLEYAKRACGYVVDMLEPNDILSVITFEERADVIMPARRVINKPLVKEYINKIYVGNTTNLYEGLMLGYQQVASVKTENTLNRVLLLTDGEPTAGTKDFASIVGQVSEQKARGITVTALGFGPDYNEELMAGIARRSGGNYYNITRPELIPEVFRKELDSLMRIAARNLRLRLHLPRGVTVKQAYGNLPVYGSRTAEVTLSDVERDSRLTSLWEVEFSPRPAGHYRVIQAELLYDDAVTGQFEKLAADAVIQFVPDLETVALGVNVRVEREIEASRAARSLGETWKRSIGSIS